MATAPNFSRLVSVFSANSYTVPANQHAIIIVQTHSTATPGVPATLGATNWSATATIAGNTINIGVGITRVNPTSEPIGLYDTMVVNLCGQQFGLAAGESFGGVSALVMVFANP